MEIEERSSAPSSNLIEVDKTLESMRDSGFDLATGSSEVVDNFLRSQCNSCSDSYC